MENELAWTEKASTDLREIFDYISEQNATAAAEVVDAIVDRVELLKTVPRMGRVYITRAGQEIRTLVSGKYRIFYSVAAEQNRVEILTVRHSARQEPDFSE